MKSQEAPLWQAAMEKELGRMKVTGTWELTGRPPSGVEMVRCHHWIFSYKYGPDGRVVQHKARLVADGSHQIDGVNYFSDKTYAPVARMVSVRALVAMAVTNDWELKQMDVSTAFLNAELDEEVYMAAPPGVKVKPGQCCVLKRAI